MSSELNRSDLRLDFMASVTFSVASVQISMSSCRRSSSVTTPLANSDWTFSARSS